MTTCGDHAHFAMQVCFANDRLGGEIFISSSIPEAEALTEALLERPGTIEIFGSEFCVSLN